MFSAEGALAWRSSRRPKNKYSISKVLSQKGKFFQFLVTLNLDLVPESKSLDPDSINIDLDPVVASSVLNYLCIAF